MNQYTVIGILAHVDAGKTTLSEALLFQAGVIRKQGRVDHKDAFLDTNPLERERGITIFSKQAILPLPEKTITLLDTPGHVDFSAETERTLQVLDAAILVISGLDGVQSHTETLWQLLQQYHIPTFLFLNKMDLSPYSEAELLTQLQEKLSPHCLSFTQKDAAFYEAVALAEEACLQQYLETEQISDDLLRTAIANRTLFPCWFGSALKQQGIADFLNLLDKYAPTVPEQSAFGAKVYKITEDESGNRLTHLKITGGTLHVRDKLQSGEKITQIRLYNGVKFQTVDAVTSGMVCAITGLSKTYAGQGLGKEHDTAPPTLAPVLFYRVQIPSLLDVHKVLENMRKLEQEDPQLQVRWNEQLQEISVRLMGEIQLAVLQRLMLERFSMPISFDSGSIAYRETIQKPVEGVGHYEPLRHYAEVHLLLEPLPTGSGLQFAAACREDDLDRNWQRLVLTHLEEKEHKGVLTGSSITDMKITLTSGRAHQKHTEGGDFRQATYRAVRQGLKKADSILLEPYYEFRMELPSENVGRAMTDIQNMSGKFGTPMIEEETTVLTGSAPVSLMRGYQKEFTAYTGGRGRIAVSLKGYDICHNQEEVLAESTYDSEADLANPTGSVFCAHGAGFVVDWDEVEEYMHMEHTLESGNDDEMDIMEVTLPKRRHSSIELTQEELDAIYVRTPDPKKNRSTGPVTVRAKEKTREPGSAYQDPKWEARRRAKAGTEEYLLVDGYNIIFSWEELKELSERDIGAARGKLADILSNYQGFRKCTLILVYDAYKVEWNPGEVMNYNNIYIVYTKEAETADQYIEKTVRRIAKNADVTVATSDGLEQVIIMGQGAHRMSAPGLKEEVELALKELRGEHLGRQVNLKNYLLDYLDEETAKQMEEIRLGKEKC